MTVTVDQLIRPTYEPVFSRALQKLIARTQRRHVSYKPLDEEPLLSTVYNIEVCATGIEYPLASGPATFTEEDLRAAVAAQDDPAVVAPRVWLGHPDDDRFHAGRATPAGSAEPALGKLVNLRLEDNDQVLVADAVGVPTWLAKILSSAYPNRSIEGYKGAETVTGHKWDLVITDLALLGVTWPGVSTLQDLEALYSAEGPEVEVEEATMTIAAASAVSAQANIDAVRKAFYAKIKDLNLSEWSWIRAMQLDPNELIVDDDEGDLFRVPFTIKGEEVDFGDPVRVKIQYVNASQKQDPASRALLTAAFTNGHKVAASWQDRADSRPESTTKEDHMTPEQLRAALGLPADATDAQVSAKIVELRASSTDVPSPDQAPPGTETPFHGPGPVQPTVPATAPVTPVTTPAETPSPDQNPAQPQEEAVAASRTQLPPGMVAVPADAWQQMQASVQAISARAQQDEVAADEALVASALREGKFFPHQRDFYASKLKDQSTREAFRHLLTAPPDQGGLAPGIVPLSARGLDPSTQEAIAEAYPASWLPEVTSRTTGDSTVTMEA